MAAAGERIESARARLIAAIDDFAAIMGSVEGSRLGEGLIHTREAKDRLDAVIAEGRRRFDKSGKIAGRTSRTTGWSTKKAGSYAALQVAGGR